jgi:NADH:ubiquinone oxidoreductase subunit 6 (subunit J)
MALMYSVMLFLNASFVLLLLGFEFLALVNLLVYVGALAVLFLFVIMLLEIPATELRACGWSLLGLAGALACRVWLLPWPIEGVAIQAQPMLCGSESLCLLGHAFFLNYADWLILNSLVLTVALFGALVLAHLRSVASCLRPFLLPKRKDKVPFIHNLPYRHYSGRTL